MVKITRNNEYKVKQSIIDELKLAEKYPEKRTIENIASSIISRLQWDFEVKSKTPTTGD